MSLQFLPYDLLFNIAQDLDIDDVHNLQATCKSLRLFTLTRPVYRQLAHDLLARSRPLPLHAFQRLSDLSTPALIAAVDRARGLEKAWAIRAPRPARPNPYYGNQWYITISVPSHEEIDWLSPITSSYTLCATKSGRVLCWDVRRDICLAEWDPRSLAGSSEGADDEDEDDEEKWELWKCRVEFEERTVYFTMARVLKGYHDDRVMEFMLMRLFFPQELDDYDEINQAQLYVQSPILSHLDHYASAVEPQPQQREGDSPITVTPRVPSPAQDPPPSIPIYDQPPTPTPSPPSSQTPSPQDSSLLNSGSFGPSSATSSAQCSPMAINAILPPDSAECSDPPQLNGIPSNQANTVGIRGDGGAGDPYQGPVFCHPSLRAMFIRSAPATPSWERYIPLPMHFDPPPPPAPVNIPIPESARPVFGTLTSFHTTGVIMNVFLLDPPRRLLSAFVWIASSNTIGLYVLLDWAKEDYVFVDTGVGCLISSNWSCILHEDQIVIHSEEADAAYQHFYPLEVLRTYGRPRCAVSLPAHAQTPPQAEEGVQQENTGDGEDVPESLKNLWNKLPTICARLTPTRSISKKFVFPVVPGSSGAVVGAPPAGDENEEDADEADETGAAEEEDQGQTEDGIEPVSEEEPTGATEVSSIVPQSEDEQSVSHDEEPVDEDEPPDDEDEELEDAHEGREEKPLTTKRRGERRARFEDEESGNDSNADEPSGSQGGEDADEVRVEDEVNAGTSSSSEPSTNPEPAPQNDEDASSSQSTTPTTPGPQQSTEGAVAPTTSESFTNPYPFPPWYPESAHFVRQWWPTLPGVPRLSCTVVLLAAHDPETHRTRFVLAQHYFKVPIAPETLPIVGKASTSSSSCSTQANDDDMLHLWYVSTPFEVVCVLEEGDDDEDTGDRPRPLVAVDFGHAVWVECAAPVVPPDLDVHARAKSNSPDAYDSDDVQPNAEPDTQLHAHFAHLEDDHSHPHPRRRVPKCLRFVTFPPVYGRRGRTEEAVVRTLEIPEELDLDVVETINIDQSQGAVILSVSDGKIFILRYE